MWPIKSKRKIYDEYMLEINRLEDEAVQLNHEIERIERKKARILGLISGLRETAKLFE